MDAGMDKEARAITGQFRGDMVTAAERKELPDRFLVEEHAHTPAMIVYDNKTGREALVPLFAYGAVREALNDLFGPPKLTVQEQLEALGLPFVAESRELTARGAFSPTERGLCYRLQIEGVDAGELGVGRISVREDGKFHLVVERQGRLGVYDTLDLALDAANEQIVPLYKGGPSYR
jgi:hypothetical protein